MITTRAAIVLPIVVAAELMALIAIVQQTTHARQTITSAEKSALCDAMRDTLASAAQTNASVTAMLGLIPPDPRLPELIEANTAAVNAHQKSEEMITGVCGPTPAGDKH